MQQLSGAFQSLPKPSGGTQGSVPVPADAACAWSMPPSLAPAVPLGLKPAALRDVLQHALVRREHSSDAGALGGVLAARFAAHGRRGRCGRLGFFTFFLTSVWLIFGKL